MNETEKFQSDKCSFCFSLDCECAFFGGIYANNNLALCVNEYNTLVLYYKQNDAKTNKKQN